MSPNEFTITRTFDAPRSALWRAWTDPAIAAQWWHPHEVVTKAGSVHIDLREGGEYGYTMVAPDGTEYPTGGTYLEVREPERLRFIWADPGDPQPERPIITVDLAILLGRNTFEMFASYWPSVDPQREGLAPYMNRLPKLVVTSTLDVAP